MIQERVDTEASRRRMSLEEELQQMKEQSRILEDKVAKAEFDCKLKEVTKGTIRRRFLISDYDHNHYLLNVLLTDMCLGYSSTARWWDTKSDGKTAWPWNKDGYDFTRQSPL